MVEALHYAFLDESGGVAIFTPGERFLIVAVLVTRKPRSLELAIKRALRRFGTSLASGEVKAAHSTDRVIRWVLESIAWQDVQIVAVAVDKQSIVKPPKDPEDLYRVAVAKAIQRCVERWPRLEITLDRRYTHEHLRHKLEWCIREKIADLEGQAVVIRQMDKKAAHPGSRFQSAGRASQSPFPAHASQRGLSRSLDGQDHQVLRYRSGYIIAQAERNVKRISG